MRLLAFQHSAGEPPAAFGAHAVAAGDAVTVVRLFTGEPIPDLQAYDALIAMGGPMDVWEHEAHPWLIPEMAAIRDWVQRGKPYLGICLGHQLLALAMGGTCKRMGVPEICVSPVTVTATEVAEDPLLSALPKSFAAMHWHGVEVATLPLDTIVLATSEGCATQAMRVGTTAWGLQFHPELEPGTVTQWMRDPANIACATDWLGSETAAWDFVHASEARSTEFLERSANLYTAFRSLV